MRNAVFLLMAALLTLSCQNADYSPKPRGYHRIDFPERAYIQVGDPGCPYSFDAPVYSVLRDDDTRQSEPCWKNLDFPQFNARLHLSYARIHGQATLAQRSEDARRFAFTHTTKATAIDQRTIRLPEHDVYGVEYSISGNTASNYQFYVSDSTTHYLRGALYFNEKPHLDSIRPVLEFLIEDIRHMISTLEWK